MATSRDLAIRTALGAGRARLVRGALAESGLLAGAGCLTGVALAWAAARRIAAIDGSLRVPLIEQTRIDAGVVAVAVAAAVVSAALFGVAPAWRGSGLADLARRVRAGGMGMSARGRGRSVLAVAEIALAVVLVVGAITLVRSFARLIAVDVGIETSDRVQTFAIGLPEARYATPHDRRQFVDRVLMQVRALPGVERAGAIFGLPLTGFGYTISVVERDGAKVPDTAQDMILLRVRVATPDYLQAIGLPLRRGRAFLPGDGPSSPRVALVNEAAARLLWPDVDALGRHVTVGTRLGQNDERVGGEIVGVVADSREGGPMSEPRPTIYVAHAQFPVGTLAVAVRRVPGGPGVSALRAVLAGLDPDVPMYRVRTTEQLAAASVAQPRLLMLLMSLFGVAALVVAAIGLYGVLAQVVEARRQEIGIRRAVGAGVNHVVGLVARETLRLLVAGVASGVACAVALTAVLPRLVSGATAPDVGAYVAAIGVFTAVAALAAAMPCRRALAVDPAVILKGD